MQHTCLDAALGPHPSFIEEISSGEKWLVPMAKEPTTWPKIAPQPMITTNFHPDSFAKRCQNLFGTNLILVEFRFHSFYRIL